MPDETRISFSYGRKITDGKYGSHDVHVSISTDLVGTLGQTLDNTKAIVYAEVQKEIDRITKPVVKMEPVMVNTKEVSSA